MRKIFFAGLIALAPLVVTVIILRWLLEFSDGLIALLPASWHPSVLLGIPLPGLGVLLALSLIMLVGVITRNFMDHHGNHWVDRLMDRIPIVRSIHSAVKQLMMALLSGHGKAFKRVVLVPFPKEKGWTIGFVTGQSDLPVAEGYPAMPAMLSVFIPTTPIPTSGWLLYIEESGVRPLDISVEQGMKLVLSGGMITPIHDLKKPIITD